MKKYLPIGSYSCCSMLMSDIAPELLYQLEQVNKRKASYWRREYREMLRDDPESDYDYLANLEDAMQEYCLPYTYIGLDGADIGCWIDYWTLEYDCPDDILKINAGDTWPKDYKKYSYILEVNDHGNMTLYNRNKKEIWSVV